MGLTVGTPVATSLIDAHAGGLGMIGVGLKDPSSVDFRNRLGKNQQVAYRICFVINKKNFLKISKIHGDSENERPLVG